MCLLADCQQGHNWTESKQYFFSTDKWSDLYLPSDVSLEDFDYLTRLELSILDIYFSA